MTQQGIGTPVGKIIGADDIQVVKFFGSPNALASDLSFVQGSTFMAVRLVADMTEMDDRNQPKRMKKRGNPWMVPGKSLRKFTTVQLTANFDYAAKVERRGGEESETKGNYSQALLCGGKVTPLSTHKGDILTHLETDPSKALCVDGKIVDCLANRRATLDADGNIQFTTQNPRVYLRAEIVRNAGEGSRQERTMRSKSVYVDETGAIVPNEEVEPFLKSRSERTDETDFVLYTLSNIIELRVGGIVYRSRQTEHMLETWPVPA